MHSFKIRFYTVCCGFLAMPFAYSQGVKIQDVVSFKPSWETGLRGGAGFNLSNSERQVEAIAYGNGKSYIVRPTPYKEYFLGGYLTRHFNPRFSLRSELSLKSNSYTGAALTAGLFPRYKLNNWLSMEAGVEANHTLSTDGKNSYRGWMGAAVGFDDVEFNLRFSPGYRGENLFGQSNWNNILQGGMSVRLSKLTNRMNGKK